MPQIYVIFRPEDSRKKSKEIISALEKTYGEDKIQFPNFDGYVDVYQIERAVQKTDYLLVIIGNYWADLVDEMGHNLLTSVYDPVHMAIATALSSRKRIVPILIDGASMPHRSRLPRELRPMTMQEAVKLDKNAPISKSLNKGLKDVIKRDGFVKIPNFMSTKQTAKQPQQPSQSQRPLRTSQQRSQSTRSSNQSHLHLTHHQKRILIGLGVCVLAIILMILMVLPTSSYRIASEASVVTAVVATVAPTSTSTMITQTENNSTLTESPPQVVTPTYPRITVDNAQELTPVDGQVVSIATADQFIFAADESLFIFADTKLQGVQVIDVATNLVITMLDTSPDEPLVIELNPDETLLHVLLSNGEVQSWGIPSQ